MDSVINLTLTEMYRKIMPSTPRNNNMTTYRRQTTLKLNKLLSEIRGFAQYFKRKNAGF